MAAAPSTPVGFRMQQQFQLLDSDGKEHYVKQTQDVTAVLYGIPIDTDVLHASLVQFYERAKHQGRAAPTHKPTQHNKQILVHVKTIKQQIMSDKYRQLQAAQYAQNSIGVASSPLTVGAAAAQDASEWHSNGDDDNDEQDEEEEEEDEEASDADEETKEASDADEETKESAQLTGEEVDAMEDLYYMELLERIPLLLKPLLDAIEKQTKVGIRLEYLPSTTRREQERAFLFTSANKMFAQDASFTTLGPKLVPATQHKMALKLLHTWLQLSLADSPIGYILMKGCYVRM